MRKKLDSLDIIRVIACFMVIQNHMHITETGYVAVTLFFILSSFLLTYNKLGRPQETPTLKSCVLFGINKTKKIYPLYIITLVFPFLMQLYGIFTGVGVFDVKFVLRTFASVALVQSLVPEMETYFFLNGVAWYLSTALILYMFYPLILRRTEKRACVKGSVAAICAAIVLQGLMAYFVPELVAKWRGFNDVQKSDFSQWLVYISPISRLADFTIGCNMAYIFVNRQEKKRSPAAATVLEALALIAVAVSEMPFYAKLFPYNVRYTTMYFPVSIFIILVFARGEGYIARFLRNKVVRFLSDISPYMFLIHPVVIMVLTIVINRLPLPFRVLQFVYLFAIPTASILLSDLYMKYENRRKQRALT